MKRWIKERPWIWIFLVLALFVTVNAILLYVAQSSHGPDLLKP